MKKMLLFTFCVLFWGIIVAGAATEGGPSPGADYLIGPGDVLDISIWKDEALTKSVLVLPDGRISFPLIGILNAAGKTLPDLKKEIEVKISKYLTDPVLTVGVNQVNSMIIYHRPGQRPRKIHPEQQRQRAPGTGHGRWVESVRQKIQHQNLQAGRGENGELSFQLR